MKTQNLRTKISVVFLATTLLSSAPALAQQGAQNLGPATAPAPFSGVGRALPNGNDPSIATTASLNVEADGDTAAKKGDWKTAAADYMQAIQYWPDNATAHFALGDHDISVGDAADAVAEYRAALYTHPQPPSSPTLRVSSPQRLMKYALVLNQMGQIAEALKAYNTGAELLDYSHGKAIRPVLLPTFGSGESQIAYTSQTLQAMAHLGVGIDTFAHKGYGDLEPFQHYQAAVQLAPDNARVHYYLGMYLLGKSDPGAKAEFQKAASLGDDQTRTAANRELQFVH